MFLKKKIKILLIILAVLIVGILSLCYNKKTSYTNFQTKYLEICERSSSESFTLKQLEKILDSKVSKTYKGNNENSNSYTFSVNDEELLILTNSNNDTLEFIQYNQFGNFELTYSSIQGTDIGGYKPGYTGKYNSSNFENQKKQLKIYFEDMNKE